MALQWTRSATAAFSSSFPEPPARFKRRSRPRFTAIEVKGEEHIANNSDPSIPEALSPVVAGVVSLHNFFAQPLHRDFGTFRRAGKTGEMDAGERECLVQAPFRCGRYGRHHRVGRSL